MALVYFDHRHSLQPWRCVLKCVMEMIKFYGAMDYDYGDDQIVRELWPSQGHPVWVAHSRV